MKHLFLVFSLFLMIFFFAPDTRAAINGSLIKSASNSSVYYLVDGKRYAFPNEKVFLSWYDNFSSVVTVSAQELASYQLAGNVTYRPGRYLVKIQTDPKVYAVSRYGELRWVTSEQIAMSLYGADWNRKVHDIPDTFFLNYQTGSPIEQAADYAPQTEMQVTQIAQNIQGASVPSINTNPYASIEQQTHTLINAHRQSKGLAPLTWNATIADISRQHSTNMANGNVSFGHDGFNQRLSALRTNEIIFSNAAENVAYNGGYEDPATVAVDGWLKSPGHLANIEGNYNEAGIGVAKNANGDYYFTHIFLKR